MHDAIECAWRLARALLRRRAFKPARCDMQRSTRTVPLCLSIAGAALLVACGGSNFGGTTGGGGGATPGGAQDIAFAREVIAQGGVPAESDFSVEGIYAE